MASQCFKCEVAFANNAKDIIPCIVCGNYFHPTCTRIGSLVNFAKMGAKKSSWKCDSCITGGSVSGGSSGNVSVAAEEEPKNSDILESLRQLQAQMTRQLEERFSGMKAEFTALRDTLKEVKESVILLTQENNALKEKCNMLEGQNTELREAVNDLREEVRDLQQYSRMDNLEIVGVPATQGEDTYAIMKSIANAIGVQYRREDVSVAHRLPKTGKREHPCIVAKFTSRSAKMEWWAAAKQKKIRASDLHGSFSGSPVYLNDHLTVHNKAVLGRARRMVKENRLAYAWVKNCRVLVRVSADGRAHHVTCAEELDSLLTQPSSR